MRNFPSVIVLILTMLALLLPKVLHDGFVCTLSIASGPIVQGEQAPTNVPIRLDTEIDWTSYMQQVSLFVNGERRYSKLVGDTGPCVYPAFHVYLYSALYYLTDKGSSIFAAQWIFSALYLVTLAVVFECYKRVDSPPWLMVLLVLSKRLHSIFMLRLFNDAWVALMLWLAIWAMQRRRWHVGFMVWVFGVGIKMTLLLAAPALAVILIQGVGLGEAVFLGTYGGMVQGFAAMPFLSNEIGFEYFFRAFDFGRRFLFKWTVNWRFLGEDMFDSRAFAITLIVLHVSLLFYFLKTRWIKPSSLTISEFVKKWATLSMSVKDEQHYSQRVTPKFVMDTMLGSMVIGLLCARSLHYQFYAYLGWATPYLLWRAGLGPVWVGLNWAVQEYSWLVYPSTDTSSMLVVLELAVQVVSVLLASPSWNPPPTPASEEDETKRK